MIGCARQGGNRLCDDGVKKNERQRGNSPRMLCYVMGACSNNKGLYTRMFIGICVRVCTHIHLL